MPKLKNQVKTFNPVKQRQVLNMTIRIGMARQGIPTNERLGELIGLSKQQFSARWVGEARWTYPELYKLVQVLRLTGDEIIQIMGGSAA